MIWAASMWSQMVHEGKPPSLPHQINGLLHLAHPPHSPGLIRIIDQYNIPNQLFGHHLLTICMTLPQSSQVLDLPSLPEVLSAVLQNLILVMGDQCGLYFYQHYYQLIIGQFGLPNHKFYADSHKTFPL